MTLPATALDVKGTEVRGRGPDWMVTAATIARRFYLDGRSKIDIAEELGVSRFQVARMLDEAQRLGLVRVTVELPASMDASLCDRLQAHLGVRRAIVVGTPSAGAEVADDEVRKAIGRVIADLLEELVQPDMLLGVACSRTVVQMTEQVERLAPCTVVQVSGTMAGTDPASGGGEVVSRLARVAHGHPHAVYAPLLVPDAAVASGLAVDSGIAGAFRRYDHLDVAVVPVGGWSAATSTVFSAVSPAERRDARRHGVVGEVTGRLFDADGRHRSCAMDRRLVAIGLDQLRRTPVVIGSAYGATRAEAVRAAVRGGLVDVLVVDTAAAEALLTLEP